MDFLADGFEGFCKALDEVKTSILFCERFDEKSDIWNFDAHKHDCIELLYFLYGNAEVSVADTSVDATFYDMIIYPKGMYHTEHLQYNHHQEVICLWVDIPGLELPDVICIQDKEAEVKWLLENLHAEYKRSNSSEYLVQHYLKAATMLLARKYFEGNRAEDSVSRVMMYIQDHMTEMLTVEHLANIVYVSKSYLSRIFKKQTGMTLIEYQRQIRINSAKTLLISSEVSIEEISYIIGYNSPKYFCRAFRDCTGKSPREYKTEERKIKAASTRI
jgi:YesN/AraC family two-component response regulator